MANAKRAADDQVRTGASTPVGSGRLRRLAPVAFLALTAPICAEYLVGYDDSIGDPAALSGRLPAGSDPHRRLD